MNSPSRLGDSASSERSSPRLSEPAPVERFAARVPTRWVRELRGRPTELAVLIALAAFADRDGRCWPSTTTIGEEAGVDTNRVGRIISALARRGYVMRELRAGKSSIYQLQFAAPHLATGVDNTPPATIEGIPPAMVDGIPPATVDGYPPQSPAVGSLPGTLPGNLTNEATPSARVDARDDATERTEDGNERGVRYRRQPRQQKLPDPHQIAAYQLLDAVYPVVVEHHEIALSRQAWRDRNKSAALDFVRQGKTSQQVLERLQAAYSGAGGGFYGGIVMLAKLAEHWGAIGRAAPQPTAPKPDDDSLPDYLIAAAELHKRDFGSAAAS